MTELSGSTERLVRSLVNSGGEDDILRAKLNSMSPHELEQIMGVSVSRLQMQVYADEANRVHKTLGLTGVKFLDAGDVAVVIEFARTEATLLHRQFSR